MAEKMTRRTFMKSAAAAAAAISLSGVLAGCGSSSGLAQNEVRVGAFIVAVYDVKGNVGGIVLGSGSNGSITATVKLTYSSSGKGFVEYPYEGMFTGKICTVPLNTDKPIGSLTMSNFAVLNWFMSKATVEVEMTIPTKEAYEKIAAGTPVEVTVKLNNVEGTLYIIQKGNTFLVLNTDPTPAD